MLVEAIDGGHPGRERLATGVPAALVPVAVPAGGGGDAAGTVVVFGEVNTHGRLVGGGVAAAGDLARRAHVGVPGVLLHQLDAVERLVSF